jgi:hypothetical protein
MNAVPDINPPVPGLRPGATTTLEIGGRSLRFDFLSALVVQASGLDDLDTWGVQVKANGGPSRLFIYRMATGGRDRGPDPLGVLKSIASDVTLAKQIPADADEGKATDYLFREGYAEWPSGALALFRNLTAAYTDIADVIGETGIIPAEFAEAVNALPYLPRCTLPNMGRTLSAVS